MEAGTGVALAVSALVVAVVVAVAALVAALGSSRRARRVAAEQAADNAALRRRLDELEQAGTGSAALAGPSPTPSVETPDEPAPVEVAATLPAPVFTDMVVRETVIRLASLTHGVRRALSPEQRMRIRFAVRQGTKRARKQRRSEVRAAVRAMQAREREAA